VSTPDETVPPDPSSDPAEAAAQAAQQAAAEAKAALDSQIRELAAQIAKETLLEFDPLTLRKGTIVSVQSTATPPTVTITLSGDTLEIPGVRYYEHYTPAVEDVVHLGKQGTDVTAIGKVAEQHSETTFTDVSLSGGFTHNGNGNGNLKIRRVWDNGVWKVQLQGAVARSSGTTIATGLDAKYRPTSATRRTVNCARDGAGQNAVKVDFGADGTVVMVGGATATGASTGDTGATTLEENAHQHTGTTSVTTPADSSHTHGSHEHVIPAVNAGPSEHNHSGAVSTVSHSHGTHNHSGTTNVETPSTSTHNHGSHEHGIDTVFHTHGSHEHTLGSHTHASSDPVWIAFNDCEYFL
jgi:hypothetical protein